MEDVAQFQRIFLQKEHKVYIFQDLLYQSCLTISIPGNYLQNTYIGIFKTVLTLSCINYS